MIDISRTQEGLEKEFQAVLEYEDPKVFLSKALILIEVDGRARWTLLPSRFQPFFGWLSPACVRVCSPLFRVAGISGVTLSWAAALMTMLFHVDRLLFEFDGVPRRHKELDCAHPMIHLVPKQQDEVRTTHAKGARANLLSCGEPGP